MTTDIHKGLTSTQVEQSRKEHGNNILTPAKRKSAFKLFIEKFNDPLIKVLMLAALLSLGISFIHNEFAETIGIFCAIMLATGVAFWFEYDAMKRFDMLSTVDDLGDIKVRRDGVVKMVARKDIVVGDVVILEAGDEIPADGTLLQAVSLIVNESSLTGELQATKTTDKAHFDSDATYSSDCLLRSTSIIEGHAIMVVTAVGDSTEFGKVARQSTIEGGEQTPLSIQLSRLSALVSQFGAAAAALIFVILLVKGFIWGGLASAPMLDIADSVLKYFMVSVTLIVVAVPEGLPMSVTLALAINMKRMLKGGTLVRRMHACETMGAVTVICTDKTGTLTQNIMKVSKSELSKDVDQDTINESVAANTTAFIDSGKVIGNPTEGALLLWLEGKGMDYETLRDKAEIIDQLTFSTERKYMATLVKSFCGSARLYIKGAPEIIMSFCDMDAEQKAAYNGHLQEYQNAAMRTIAMAYIDGDDNSHASCKQIIEQGGLKFIGIVGISDPIREDVPEAMARCSNAGISVKIITGDTPATAREIARQAGLWNDSTDGPANQITGVEFAEMSDQELLERIDNLKIMARARPLDKQRLVRLLQSKGEVVAVTGDGTNDAPALNFAQVGLAMGSGTSVAKEAGDITLLDDSFATIATAVMWGRSLYNNIQRFIMFQLTINVVAVAILVIGSIFGHDLPLTVTQMLWVNIIMDTFAAMALASLPPDKNVMKKKPRKNTDFIITKAIATNILVTSCFIVGVLFGMLVAFGVDASVYQLTLLFTTFVMMQFWNMFNAAEYGIVSLREWSPLRSKPFLGILSLIFAGQVLIVSYGSEVFRTSPLSIRDWAIIIIASSSVFIFGRIVRHFRMVR
ncbi:MAG: calcium-translocating P-type ATPase, PMCA-type [Rikenellaceae bacterium]